MTCDSEHYYAVQTFLEDDELCKIWNIIEIAMNREGWLCADCNWLECDRCDEKICCNEDITPYIVYEDGREEFSDGAHRVHEECLTKEEKEIMEANNQ